MMRSRYDHSSAQRPSRRFRVCALAIASVFDALPVASEFDAFLTMSYCDILYLSLSPAFNCPGLTILHISINKLFTFLFPFTQLVSPLIAWIFHCMPHREGGREGGRGEREGTGGDAREDEGRGGMFQESVKGELACLYQGIYFGR